MNERTKKILNFWFSVASEKEKFTQNQVFDKKIHDLFFEDYNKAINNEYDYWQDDPNDCLALIILLDQFSRNLFRKNSKAFLMDYKARQIAKKAIIKKYHEKIHGDKLIFIFLPFMHSEQLSDQIYCINLVNSYLKKNKNYNEIIKFAKIHKEIINKFGRFPHRNKVLGRKNTMDEEEYLNSTNHGFFNI